MIDIFFANKMPIKQGMVVEIMIPKDASQMDKAFDGVITRVKDLYYGELCHLENITGDISFHSRVLFPVKDNIEDILEYLNGK